MLLYMYTAPGQRQTIPWGQNFDINRKAKSLFPICCKFLKISFKSNFIHIFSCFYTCIKPQARDRQPLEDKILISTEKPNYFAHLLQVSKKSPSSLILYIFFHAFIHVKSPRPGTDNPLRTKFWYQKKSQITLPICCKFLKNLFQVWFYTNFFMLLYKYIAQGQGQTTPWGQNFVVNRKAKSLCPFCCKFQKNLFEVWFYTYFFMLLYMYIAPGQGQITPWRQNFDVNRKALSLCPFVASFEKISLKSDFIHIFSCFYTCI